MTEDDRLVTVCAKCLTASCWHGIFYCDEYMTAGTVDRTIADLRKLALENPCYWSMPHLRKMGIER
jgi:hypothetical protein